MTTKKATSKKKASKKKATSKKKASKKVRSKKNSYWKKTSKKKTAKKSDDKPLVKKDTKPQPHDGELSFGVTAEGKPRVREAKPGEGRPTKYKEEFCESVFEWMKQGKSLESWGAHVGLSMASIHKYRHTYPSFSTACETGRQAALAYYEAIAKAQANGAYKSEEAGNLKHSNAGMVKFLLARRFKEYQPESLKIEGVEDLNVTKTTVYTVSIGEDGGIKHKKEEFTEGSDE